MGRKFVIIPCFGEAHFTHLQIENFVEIIEPDAIIYNEGLFPDGPENKGGIDPTFREQYCYGNTNQAWDTELLQQSIKDAQAKYPHIKMIWNPMHYTVRDCNQCYVEAVSNFVELGIQVQPGDLIFPLEGDVFFHEHHKDALHAAIKQLAPGQGYRAKYVPFMENQFYIEKSSLTTCFERRVVICFRDWAQYRQICYNFMSQTYTELQELPFGVYHYAWWRPGKYKEMRRAQLIRSDEYHKAIFDALDKAKELKETEIVIRPTKAIDDPWRYLTKVEVSHPKHIHSHPNYVRTTVN